VLVHSCIPIAIRQGAGVVGVPEASAVPVHLMCLGRTRLTRAVQLSPTAAGRFLVPHPGWLGCWRYLRLSSLHCICPRLSAVASACWSNPRRCHSYLVCDMLAMCLAPSRSRSFSIWFCHDSVHRFFSAATVLSRSDLLFVCFYCDSLYFFRLVVESSFFLVFDQLFCRLVALVLLWLHL